MAGNRFRRILLILGLFALVCSSKLLYAQQPTLQSARQQLQQIQQQIQQLKKQLARQEHQLRSEMEVLGNLEQQITLGKKALRLLEKEIRLTEQRVAQLTRQVDSLQNQISLLRKLFSRQVVFSYKYQRGHLLDWVLGAQNLNQALVRYWYFRKIATSARSLYERIVQKEKELARSRAQLSHQLEEQKLLLAEKSREQQALESRRRERAALVKKIRANKKLLARALEEKEKNYQKLKDILGSLEAKRETRQLPPHTQVRWEKISGRFDRQKGRLNWPVEGSILHPFGNYKNPELKTVRFNPGIDLRAPRGAPVRCVFPGVVSAIRYVPGFGNTVFVDHNDGYYTVYAHLEEVLVSFDQFVEAGEVLGTVGESGSVEGPLLHFSIYGKGKVLNPLAWLKGKR